MAEEHAGGHSDKEGADKRLTDASLTAGPAQAPRSTTRRDRLFAENERVNDRVCDSRIPEGQHDITVPNTVPQPHEKGQDREECQGVKRKGRCEGQSQAGMDGQAMLPNAIRQPTLAAPTEPRRVRVATDTQEDRESGEGTSAKECSARNEEDEDGEDALLLPEPSDSPKERTERGDDSDERQGMDSCINQQLSPGQGKPSAIGVAQRLLGCRALARENEKTVVQTAPQQHLQQKLQREGVVEEKTDNAAEEELVVDDIDDESSALLDPSPNSASSCIKPASKSTPTSGDSTVKFAPSSSPPFWSSLSSTTTSVRPPALVAAATVAPDLAPAQVAMTSSSAPAPTPAPAPATAPAAAENSSAVSPIAAAPPAKTAQPYNYYDLPPIPEKTTGEEKTTVRHSAGVEGIAGKIQEPSSTGEQLFEEKVGTKEGNMCSGNQERTRSGNFVLRGAKAHRSRNLATHASHSYISIWTISNLLEARHVSATTNRRPCTESFHHPCRKSDL